MALSLTMNSWTKMPGIYDAGVKRKGTDVPLWISYYVRADAAPPESMIGTRATALRHVGELSGKRLKETWKMLPEPGPSAFRTNPVFC